MKRIFIILMLAVAIVSAHAQQTDKRLKGLDKELNKVLKELQPAGFAVAVVEKDKVIYSRGFGYRDYEEKIPVDENTLFAIGSCTKSFTTSLIGMLEEEGELSLNDKPSLHIPGFSFSNEEMNSNIRIKDMMSHGTGLPRHDFSWYFFPGKTKKDLLMRVAEQDPFTGVRENWYYNNFMFLAQGVIVEEITGKSWEDNIREKIFEPLGMERSNLSIAEMKKSDNVSFGYQLEEDDNIEKMDYYNIGSMSPAGSINSSAEEMSHWLKTWIHGGKYKDEQVIPSAFVQKAISSQIVASSALPDKDHPGIHITNYGYGWFISSYKGHYRAAHGGNIDGFSADACIFPSDSIGIAVLTNQNSSVVPNVVRNIVSDRIFDLEKTNWIKEAKKELEKAVKAQKEMQETSGSNRIKGTKPSHSLKDYTGSYSNKGYSSFNIKLSGDSLYAELPLHKYWLRHHHYDVFEPVEMKENGADTTQNIQLLFNFTSTMAGEISGVKVKMEPTINPITFKRTPEIVEVEKETLEKYPGSYDLMGTEIKVYIKDDDKLFVLVPGQPEYELLSTGNNKFSIKVLDGYSVEFVEGKDNKINALKFIQPNGIFTANRK
ncbi:MAG TPA: serine hydrolase [Bacteroidales bacterium]|nr:serine hydrolase [Bacteroidales bacterium]